mmetsp:Transcript_10499/g.18562  ORF Transcript_10499/g.18562 Transcript_10499/m.18562 type:complete len:356 (+) Transcript_10499:2290-3357(+)
MRPDQQPVEEDEEGLAGVHLRPREQGHVLHPQVQAGAQHRPLLRVACHMREECKVFDKSAGLALRGVGGAEDAPLRGLQRAGAGDLLALLELRVHAGHHAHAAHVGQPVQHLADAGALHLEALEHPVPGSDAVHEALGNGVRPDGLNDVEGGRAVCLGEHHVGLAGQFGVEALEEVLEQQGQQVPRQLQPLVPVVVLVVQEGGVQVGVKHAAHYVAGVHRLEVEAVVLHGDVAEDHVRQHLARLVLGGRAAGVGGAAREGARRRALLPADLEADEPERLLLGEDAEAGGLLEGAGQRVRQLGLRANQLHNIQVALHAHGLEHHHDGHLVAQRVVLQVHVAFLNKDIAAALALVGR